MAQLSLAQAFAEGLRRHKVKRIFGVPGGGSALPIIEAAGKLGIDFILARTEASAAMMAAVTGEISGAPGVVLACLGPGAASLVNGVAYAHLEHAPLLVLTDGPAASLHQRYDQNALFKPISKHQGRLRPEGAVIDIEDALVATMQMPRGVVQFNINASEAVAQVIEGEGQLVKHTLPTSSSRPIEDARELLKKSRKPILVVGLEARYGGAPASTKRLAEALNCPILLTYKAKGVVSDQDVRMAGIFTGASSEFKSFGEVDAIVTFGLDPVEIIAGEWLHSAPIIEIRETDLPNLSVESSVRIIGSLTDSADTLLTGEFQSNWTPENIGSLRKNLRDLVAVKSNTHTAQSVAESIVEAAPSRIRASVDAGAHMISAMAAIQADQPFGVLKSNGLSTMGYALPAAIASSLHEPEIPAVAVIGDGGLMMCLAELTTAAEHNCNVVTVVLNDSALSLIDIKQQRQGYARAGVEFPFVDFAAVAEGMGVTAWRVGPSDDILTALKQAFAHDGPALVDVIVDASVYKDQVARLRG